MLSLNKYAQLLKQCVRGFEKIFVANRGKIAARVLQWGITTVAVCSGPDVNFMLDHGRPGGIRGSSTFEL
ncbi:unnamed protein product [Peronospora effusa]|nr:unnamed protein product [Peronospora effusa]